MSGYYIFKQRIQYQISYLQLQECKMESNENSIFPHIKPIGTSLKEH